MAAAVAVLVLVGAAAALAVQQERRWRGARVLDSVTSPDGRWRIDGLSLAGDGTSALRLRVHRLPDDGSPPAVASGRFVHGAYRPGFDCSAAGCTTFWWSAGNEDRIALPPSLGARLRGRLLHSLGPSPFAEGAGAGAPAWRRTRTTAGGTAVSAGRPAGAATVPASG